MALTKGLTSGDSMFNSVADLQASKSRIKTIVSTNDGTTIQFYTVSASDLGSGVVLASGLFANPIGVASIADPQTATNTSDISDLEALNSWDIPETSDFTAVASESRQIDATANTIDVTLPVLVIGDSFTYHNLITSTFKVQILNPIETIKGKGGDIAAGTNMELAPGDSVQVVAKSTTILSIVGAQV